MSEFPVAAPDTDVSTPELIAGVGNHEAKSLMLLYLGQSAGYHGYKDLASGFMEFVGTDQDIWRPAPSVPFGYCRKSLEPIGQVVRRTVQTNRGRNILFGISENGSRLGIPAVGLLLNWGLEYDDISVQQVFGPTSSKGDTRAPQHRIDILSRLVRPGVRSLSAAEISGMDASIDTNTKEYKTALAKAEKAADALARSGIVIVERKKDNNDRAFVIDGLDQPRGAGSPRGPITSAIHDFIGERYVANNVVFTSEECAQYVIARLSQSEGSDPAEIRQRVMSTLGSKSSVGGVDRFESFPSVKRLERRYRGSSHTLVRINDAHRGAIDELMQVVQGLAHGNDEILARGKELSSQIALDGTKKALLMNKAYNFSSAAQKRMSAETMDELIAIVTEMEAPSEAETIYQAFIEKSQRPYSEDALRQLLKSLVTNSRLSATMRRPKSSSRVKRIYYSLSE